MFIDWLAVNCELFAKTLNNAILSEPPYFNKPDGRFMKDKLHMRALQRKFPKTFDRVENSVADLLFVDTEETISLKSQATIFQHTLKNGTLSIGRYVTLVNANSTYAEPNLIDQRKRLSNVDYFILYQPQTIKQPFAFGLITGKHIIEYLLLSGSQVKFRANNAQYDLFYSNVFEYVEKNNQTLETKYWNAQNSVFDILLDTY